MHLETTRFVSLEIDASTILKLNQPIIGRPAFLRFILPA